MTSNNIETWVFANTGEVTVVKILRASWHCQSPITNLTMYLHHRLVLTDWLTRHGQRYLDNPLNLDDWRHSLTHSLTVVRSVGHFTMEINVYIVRRSTTLLNVRRSTVSCSQTSLQFPKQITAGYLNPTFQLNVTKITIKYFADDPYSDSHSPSIYFPATTSPSTSTVSGLFPTFSKVGLAGT